MVHLAECCGASDEESLRPAPTQSEGSSGGDRMPFTELIGIDIAIAALVRGRKRLQVTHTKHAYQAAKKRKQETQTNNATEKQKTSTDDTQMTSRRKITDVEVTHK
jgi:hypothetical protein